MAENDMTIEFEGLRKMIKEAMPILGYLDTETSEHEGNKTINFRDYHRDEMNWDMATPLCKLTLDAEGTIQLVEHGLTVFNATNKNVVLFLSSLIGKKLIVKGNDADISPLRPKG